MASPLLSRVVEYLCQSCGKNDWVLRLGYSDDGKTLLMVNCADPACTEKLRQEHGGQPTDLFLWDQLDISGQGHDLDDTLFLSPGDIN